MARLQACEFQVRGLSDTEGARLKASVEYLLPANNVLWDDERRLQVSEAAQLTMQTLGYYHANIGFASGNDACIMQVQPGPPVLVQSFNVVVEGQAKDDPSFQALVADLPLKVGDVLDQSLYEKFRVNVDSLARAHGYFDAHWIERVIHLNQDHNTATIIMKFDSGERYRLGAVSFKTPPVSRLLLRHMVPFKPGTPYDASLIMQLNKNLLDSHYFKSVEVLAPQENAVQHVIPVQVNLVAGKRNNMAVGLGYATDIGPRISANWSRPLLTQDGHSVAIDTQFSPVQSSIQATYNIPLAKHPEDALQFLYGFQRYVILGTVTDSTVLGPQITGITDKGWHRLVYLHWNRDDFSRTDGSTGRSNLLLPGMSWTLTHSRGGVDPDWGDQQTYTIEGGSSSLLSDANEMDVHAGWRLLRTLAERHQFFFRLDTGAVASNRWSNIPPTLRFFAGGDQSIRGYGFNALGPTDSQGNVLGGHYLAVGSIQYGYQLRPQWRPHVFFDMGNAYDSLHGPTRRSTGVGVSWRSPVGPISMDVGFGLLDPSHPVRLHFYMGPPL